MIDFHHCFAESYLFYMTLIVSEFLAQHTVVLIALHVLSVCFGLGGATISDAMLFRFLGDFRISKREASIMHWMSKFIVAAIIMIYITGGAIYLTDMDRYINSAPFIFKMFVVLILTINGIILHEYISPQLVKISFVSQKHVAISTLNNLRRVAFAMGALSFTSWYTVFFVAMLKSLIPDAVTLQHLIFSYVAVVLIAICTSQAMEHLLYRRSLSR